LPAWSAAGNTVSRTQFERQVFVEAPRQSFWFRETFQRNDPETIWRKREDSPKRFTATIQFASAEVEIWRSPMSALVQAFSQASRSEIKISPFAAVMTFCGAVLLAS